MESMVHLLHLNLEQRPEYWHMIQRYLSHGIQRMASRMELVDYQSQWDQMALEEMVVEREMDEDKLDKEHEDDDEEDDDDDDAYDEDVCDDDDDDEDEDDDRH